MTEARKPYPGKKRKLVLAFDVKTIYSGISYSILDPGHVPEIRRVTRFLGHEPETAIIGGDSKKILSVVYYDQAGKVCAVGAEAIHESILDEWQAEDEGWIKCEWFKLHMRPKTDRSLQITVSLPPLPPNKTGVDVMADFLSYLLRCASQFIQDTHADGPNLWKSVQEDIDYVVSHPNDWEGLQQTHMREAIVKAGLISDTDRGHSRVSFVTEGEASLHFSIENGLPSRAIEKGEGIDIVDAGGGTVDRSRYHNYANVGHMQGSVFVSARARVFLEEFLANSDYIEDLDHIVRCFDATTKVRFSGDKQPQYVKFGFVRDNDASCNIRFGQLKLAWEDVATFFEPSISESEYTKEIEHELTIPKYVVLVGGFAANEWFFTQVISRLKKHEVAVIRPDPINNAVSYGAILFYLNHQVTTRVAKFTYGQFRTAYFDPSNPEHRAREKYVYECASGDRLVPNFFAVLLNKDTQVEEGKEFRQGFGLRSERKEDIQFVTSKVYAYKGKNPQPRWRDVDHENYVLLCTIHMDLAHIPLPPRRKTGGLFGTYYYLSYHLVLSLTGIEMKAHIAWEEDGIEKRSPATIVYDPPS